MRRSWQEEEYMVRKSEGQGSEMKVGEEPITRFKPIKASHVKAERFNISFIINCRCMLQCIECNARR